jgi:hypothetical protein
MEQDMNHLSSRLHNECIERCLSQPTPRMICKGCSDEFYAHRLRYFKTLSPEEREKFLAAEQAE